MQQAYAKREIADAHLARALALFIDVDDYLCAITLAGAADEIYGKLYRAKVAQDAAANADREDKPDPRASIDHEVDTIQAVGAHFGEKIERTEAIASLNSARDAMKHFTAGGDPVTLDAPHEAAEIHRLTPRDPHRSVTYQHRSERPVGGNSADDRFPRSDRPLWVVC